MTAPSDIASPQNCPADSGSVLRLVRRLGVHRRRMRYWSGLPSLAGFGPTGKSLQSGHMDMKYEEACADAMSIAQALEDAGRPVTVVDIKATFAVRWSNPKAPEVLLYPTNASTLTHESEGEHR